MTRSARSALLFLLLFAAATDGASPPRVRPIAATIDTTLTTCGEQIRQLAFDGDEASFFASQQPPGADDHFTVVLDEPVQLRSIAAITGRADGGDAVRAGTLEVSADGTTFRELARFGGGTARGGPAGGNVRAIRIRPGPADGPIAIRELTIDSDPPVGTFRYPVEFVVETAEAPDLRPWAESTARACERTYPLINDELGSDGYRPPRLITLTLTTSYAGVAKMSGTHIVGSVDHFRGHRRDVGAIVHETTRVAQDYRRGERPSWLVEGLCDYVRFFKWEPGKLGKINPRTARYDRSYRVTAAFLVYLVETYDKDIVRKLNRALRDGRYEEDLFQQLTGKTVQERDEEWRAKLEP
jgi:Peptidase of plants and bacteria